MKSGGVVALAALAGLLLGLLIGRSGAEPASPGPTYLSQVTEDLGLRPAQVAEVAALLAAEDEALQALVDDARHGLSAPVAARHRQTEAELLALLDPEQRQRYDALAQR